MKRRVGKFTVFNKPRSKTAISVQNFKLYNLYKREIVSFWRGWFANLCSLPKWSGSHRAFTLDFSCKVSSDFWKRVLSWNEGCQFMKSLLKTLQKKMSFLVSSLLEKIFSRLITFCFWVSLIFILGNARIVYLLFRVSLPGQGVSRAYL